MQSMLFAIDAISQLSVRMTEWVKKHRRSPLAAAADSPEKKGSPAGGRKRMTRFAESTKAPAGSTKGWSDPVFMDQAARAMAAGRVLLVIGGLGYGLPGEEEMMAKQEREVS